MINYWVELSELGQILFPPVIALGQQEPIKVYSRPGYTAGRMSPVFVCQ